MLALNTSNGIIYVTDNDYEVAWFIARFRPALTSDQDFYDALETLKNFKYSYYKYRNNM